MKLSLVDSLVKVLIVQKFKWLTHMKKRKKKVLIVQVRAEKRCLLKINENIPNQSTCTVFLLKGCLGKDIGSQMGLGGVS